MTKEEALAKLRSRVSARITDRRLEEAINKQDWNLPVEDLILDLFEARVALNTLLTFLSDRQWNLKDWNDAQQLYLDKLYELTHRTSEK